MLALLAAVASLQPLHAAPRAVPSAAHAVRWSSLRPGLAAAAAAAMPLIARADEGGLPIVGKFFETEEGKTLGIYFAQTVINWGVPAAVALAFVIATAPGRRGDEEMPQLPLPLARALGVSKEPKEYLKIERLNTKLASFDFSIAKATVSRESALRAAERQALERRFGAEVASFGLTSTAVRAIAKAEERYRLADAQIAKELESKTRKLRALSLSPFPLPRAGKAAVASKGESAEGAEGAATEAATEAVAEASTTAATAKTGSGNPFAMMQANFGASGLSREVAKLQERQTANELRFLATLGATLEPEQAARLAAALLPKSSELSATEPGGGGVSAVAALAGAAAAARAAAPHVFVLSFFGDVTASQVATLRQEITAVLRAVTPGRSDEVLLVLNTGGGTVTGYGLAAAQLTRLKAAGVRLTICVEQVAASGGYMMACCADELLCAPFAVIGSIGVITEQPNVYERLKQEGIVFSTVTAGKFKRTLTPTKKIDPKDTAKTQEDIEQVLNLFADFVGQQRPQLDVSKVATGETWLGPDALKLKLVDGLSTVDEVLLRRVDEGREVYSVTYQDKERSPLAAFGVGGSGAGAGAWWLVAAGLQQAAAFARTLAGGGGGPPRGALGGALGGAADALSQRAARGDWGYGADASWSSIGQPLASRPTGEIEPEIRWEGAPKGEEPSWFL